MGRRLKIARVAQDLTIAELSEISGITQPTISRLERGIHQPALYTVSRLAEALHVKMSDLFSEEGMEENVPW